MQSRMHPKYYLSQEIFDREQERIFRKLWLFAGLASLVPKNHSYMTRKIAGIPVVIQNFNGELKAFENICLHRSAPLQQGYTGTRPLVCPYHAWSYDVQGAVRNIPDRDKYYRFSDEEQASLRLRAFALRQVGQLLFVNLDEHPLPFEEQFDPAFVDSLESVSNAFDGEIMATTWHAGFNWKLINENLHDSHHVRFLHAQSLAGIANFPFGPKDEEDLAVAPLTEATPAELRRAMRSFSHRGPDGEIGMPREPWMDMVERWGDTDGGYLNWQLYPNLHMATGNGGHSFTIENYLPVAPGRTDVEILFVTGRKKKNYAASSKVLLENMHFSKRILGEDFGMLEKIQADLHEGAPVPTQGAYEYLNRQSERFYTALMESGHAFTDAS